jgi:diadenylate cyclase
MSEQSDAVVLIVSEETGALSIAYDSRLYYDLSTIEITRKLKDLLDRGGGKFADQKDKVSSAYNEYGSSPISSEKEILVEQ